MKYVFFTFLIVVFGVHLLHAQSTTLKLPTATSASDFTVTDSSNNVLMKILGNGRVGIGTSNPNEPLEVASSTARAIISDGGGSTRRGLLLVGPTSSSDYARIESFFYPSTGKPLVINNSGQGKVGIWTTNPQQALHVNGTIYSSSGGFKFPDNTTQTTAAVSSQWTTSGSNIYYSTGKVGIGTSTFNGTLSLAGDDGILASGTHGSGTALSLGAGTRLMWYPRKSALRAGNVNGTEWNDGSIGNYSAAFGQNTIASGVSSLASGSSTTASGSAAAAFGTSTTASGTNSFAAGSTAQATGTGSVALGLNATASGYSAIAIGEGVTASGDRSIALGTWVSTAGQYGSCIIGDASTSQTAITNSLSQNQMTMRFDGGYKLYTRANLSNWVELASGGNSWSSSSDSTRKENFLTADGEYFLSSLSKLKLGSWNFKGQDPKHYRHYGPMAQEIFHYFGYDGIGTIGNDTTLATADMDGIIMICLQALEKRTEELLKAKETLVTLKEVLHERQSEIIELKKAVAALAGLHKEQSLIISTSERGSNE
jgi:hypothetical protein